MSKIKDFLRLFLIVTICPILVLSSCQLSVNGKSPQFIRQFGSRKIIQKTSNYIYLSVGETITGYCSGNFRVSGYNQYISEDDSEQTVTFYCTPQGLFVEQYMEENQAQTNLNVWCSDNSLKIFESNVTLPNCIDYMSYGIGVKSLQSAELKTFAMCFDLDTLSIKYMKYLTYRLKNNIFPQMHTFKEVPITSLDTELNYLDTLFSFISKNDFRTEFERRRSSDLLLIDQEFVFDSLIQDPELMMELETFGYMFNIAWWRTLLKGNWFFFSNALRNRAENVTYMAYTGISHTLNVPSLKRCEDTEEFEISVNGKTVKVPAYVYMYLHSVETDVEEDVVFIGYNTPYFTLNETELLCDDICDQIDWLKSSLFGRTHLMPVYGVMICCRPEDVVGKLQNFPFEQDKVLATTQPNL